MAVPKPDFARLPTVIPPGSGVDMFAKALLMKAGSYEAACSELEKHRDWLKPLDRDVDDRVLLDIAYAEQVNPGCDAAVRREGEEFVHELHWPDEAAWAAKYEPRCRDNAVLTKVANMAYRGKAADAARRRLLYALRKGSLRSWWRKRWARFFRRQEPGN
jgi:hypothetical protein